MNQEDLNDLTEKSMPAWRKRQLANEREYSGALRTMTEMEERIAEMEEDRALFRIRDKDKQAEIDRLTKLVEMLEVKNKAAWEVIHASDKELTKFATEIDRNSQVQAGVAEAWKKAVQEIDRLTDANKRLVRELNEIQACEHCRWSSDAGACTNPQGCGWSYKP